MFNVTSQPAGVEIIPNSATAAQWYTLWDSLGLVKTLLGNDQSGTLPIYSYAYSLNTNAPNVLLISAVHGSEYIGPKLLYRAAAELMTSTVPELVFLRNRYSFTFVPIVNPYGINNTTYNNGNVVLPVNLNRNMGTEAEWTANSDPDKGDSWKSEAESQIIDGLLTSLQPVLMMDVHNTDPILNGGISYAYVIGSTKIKEVCDLICGELFPAVETVDVLSQTSMAINLASEIYGSNAVGIDFIPSGTGHDVQSSGDITDGVDQVLNIMYQLIALGGEGVSSLPIITGTERVIRIKQKAEYIPSTQTDIPLWIPYSTLLADSKFDSFRAACSSVSKLGVVDASAESERSRYSDSLNYGLFFKGTAEQDKEYLLCVGNSLNKSNSPLPYTDAGYKFSAGFIETSGNPVDRSGTTSPIAANIEAYNVAGSLDKAYKFNGSNSIITMAGAGALLTGQTKLTVHMKLSQDILLVSDRIIRCLNGSNFFQISLGALGVYVFVGTASDYVYAPYPVDAGAYFTLSVCIDMSAAVPAPGKCLIYVNGVLSPITNSAGNWNTTTVFPDFGTADLTVGSTSLSLDGNIDELDIVVGQQHTANRCKVFHNNWSQADYWSAKIQPIILSVSSLGGNRFSISGSGFKPGEVDPTGTIGGVPFTVESTTDTEVVIVYGIGTSTGAQTVIITNSDGESDSDNITINTTNTHTAELSYIYSKRRK